MSSPCGRQKLLFIADPSEAKQLLAGVLPCIQIEGKVGRKIVLAGQLEGGPPMLRQDTEVYKGLFG